TSPTGPPSTTTPPLEYKPPAPAPRITLAGSLDPTTGIFYRTPEHPRLRTAQACEKCRTRKAKVSRLWKKHPLTLTHLLAVLWRPPRLFSLRRARSAVRVRQGGPSPWAQQDQIPRE
ncbi:hypothetical protein C8R46DRAFT_1087890, partial [Mycena filopes]